MKCYFTATMAMIWWDLLLESARLINSGVETKRSAEVKISYIHVDIWCCKLFRNIYIILKELRRVAKIYDEGCFLLEMEMEMEICIYEHFVGYFIYKFHINAQR